MASVFRVAFNLLATVLGVWGSRARLVPGLAGPVPAAPKVLTAQSRTAWHATNAHAQHATVPTATSASQGELRNVPPVVRASSKAAESTLTDLLSSGENVAAKHSGGLPQSLSAATLPSGSSGPPGLGGPSRLAGSSHPVSSANERPEARRVQMAAGGEALGGIDSPLAIQFFLALLPAIIVEILVLKPVQDFFVSSGWKNEREYVTGSDDTIAVQIPFNSDLWIAHKKNPDRYVDTVSGLFGKTTLLQRLQGPLLVLNIVSAAELFYNIYFQPLGWAKLSLPLLPFTISSFALGLLLVFRVNNATNRYVKARDLWGDMLNISRDLIQQASQWSSREDFIDFARWVPAFTTGLMCQLRDPSKHDLAQELREAAGSDLQMEGEGAGLTEEEIQLMCSRPNMMLPAHYVTHILRAKIKTMSLPLEQRLLMEGNVTRLINDMGACENIFATPIPVGYTKHTSRFLFLWLFFLPFALTEQLGLGTIFAQQVLSFGLLGIEDIGIQIEEPFAVLPLKKICFKIANEGQIVRSNIDYLDGHAKANKA